MTDLLNMEGSRSLVMPYQRISLREDWVLEQKEILDKREGIPAVIKTSVLFEWDKLRGAPNGRASDQLRYAIEVACVDYDHELVGKCLQRCLTVIDAGAKDARWQSWWGVARNADHGEFVSVGEFARAWVENRQLDGTQLVFASEELLRGALEDRPVWSELAQSEYLHAVQLLLAAGEIERAMSALNVKKKFKRVQQYFDWHVQLVGLISQPEELCSHFDRYFDVIRAPRFQPPANDSHGRNLMGLHFAKLRLAVLRWQYVEKKPVGHSWRHVVDQIRY